MKSYTDNTPYTLREAWRDLMGGWAMVMSIHRQADKLLVLLEKDDWEEAHKLNEKILNNVNRIQGALSLPDNPDDWQSPPIPKYEYRILRQGPLDNQWESYLTNKRSAPYRTVGHAKAAISRPTRGKFKIQRRSVGEWEDHLEVER